jgi:hypothetical protein
MIWQVFWLAGLMNTFPSASDGQWYFFHLPRVASRKSKNLRFTMTIHDSAYSYGDSAGFSPDFPFNSLMIF